MERSVVIHEYARTLRRVSRVIDNMMLHFRMKQQHKVDAEEEFATRPVRVSKNRPSTTNGSLKNDPIRGNASRRSSDQGSRISRS